MGVSVRTFPRRVPSQLEAAVLRGRRHSHGNVRQAARLPLEAEANGTFAPSSLPLCIQSENPALKVVLPAFQVGFPSSRGGGVDTKYYVAVL